MPNTSRNFPVRGGIMHRLGGGVVAAARLCVIAPFGSVLVYMLLYAVSPSSFTTAWMWLQRAVVAAGILGLLYIFVKYPWHANRPPMLTHALAVSFILVVPATVTGFWPAAACAIVTPLLVAGFFIAERYRRA
ncbi:hypothetical protein [Streptomyces sp. Ru87]|uniref:hypothetical protein n=1 Tax=Streptomyces sp. Ru87 TaxID=2044307 RepID=UPI00117D164C|nr:hypothetical protein [Streptomyces sp. Ru87]